MLYLTARRLSPRARIPPMNLVATDFDRDGAAGVSGSLMRFRPRQGGLFEGRDEGTPTEDLGVRFDGEPLAAGLRLRSLLVEGRYDVVVFNPPYLATAKIDLPAAALSAAFGESPDLFAAFVDRAFELCKPSGLVAFVALSNWMFLSTFQATRERVLSGHVLLLAELGKGAFRRASKLIQSAMVVVSPARPREVRSLAARVGSQDTASATAHLEIAEGLRKEARYAPFDPGALARFEGAPLLFWLDPAFVRRYAELPKIDDVASLLGGIATTGNERFLRAVWEVPADQARAAACGAPSPYLPYIKGAEGREWIEPYRWVLRADRAALELRVLLPAARVERPELGARALGVAYTTIGHRFAARLHTVPSVRDVSGASVFPRGEVSAEALVCALNRTPVRELCAALNPTVNFQLGDVRRLPFDAVEGAAEIVAVLRAAFADHERGSELSLDYDAPRPTTWSVGAHLGAARRGPPRGEPLPLLDLQAEPPSPWLRISHALGIALGRFGAEGGIATAKEQGLPDGILLLGPESPSLDHAACLALREAWQAVGAEIGGGFDLSTTLRKSFFAEHRRLYEGAAHPPAALLGEAIVRRLRLLPPAPRRDALRPAPRSARDAGARSEREAPRRAGRLHRPGPRDRREGPASARRQDARARGGRALGRGPGRRRDRERRRALAAPRSPVEGPEALVDGDLPGPGEEGPRLVPRGRPILRGPRAPEVPRRSLPRRRPPVLLGAPPGEGVRLGAAATGRDRARLHPRRARHPRTRAPNS